LRKATKSARHHGIEALRATHELADSTTPRTLLLFVFELLAGPSLTFSRLTVCLHASPSRFW
jgi:hypothetical protein